MMQQMNHLNLKQKIGLKYMMNHEERIMSIIKLLDLKIQ